MSRAIKMAVTAGVLLSMAASAVVAQGKIAAPLQKSFVWATAEPPKQQTWAIFRKMFELAAPPKHANLHLFADSRYLLYINGKYVLRGPGRFDPVAPQYDTVDVGPFLHAGKNAVAVVVHAYIGGENGRTMNHVPGLALLLEMSHSVLQTGADWRVNTENRYLPSPPSWGSILDNIDARRDTGDWTQVEFDDSEWQTAKAIDGKQWGQLSPRSIPLLKEEEVQPTKLLAVSHSDGERKPLKDALPLTLETNQTALVNIGRMAQAYSVIDFEAEAGTVLELECALGFQNGKLQENYNMGRYVAKAGRQIWMTGDVWGCHYLTLRVVSGKATVHGLKVVNRSYPFVAVSPFQSDDAFLDELWVRSVRTVMLCSEDGYLDCTPRERAEWMGDAALVEYPVTRLALTGFDLDGAKHYADPRLIRQMLRHVAQSHQADGRLKAHHPSDRWDIHGYIEDYSCLWVQTLRTYFDMTSDRATVEELWPALVKQMAWFLERKTANGLVKAREFVFFDNLNKYKVGESATLNAYLVGALRDAAYLAKLLGKTQEKLYKTTADEITTACNATLWNEAEGTYFATIVDGQKLEPTAHAAMIALYYNLVPKERIERVLAWLIAHRAQVDSPYAHRFLLEVLLKQDRPELDRLALEIIHNKWRTTMNRQDTGTVFEVFGGGSLCHNMGAMGAYFLSAFVLGVRMEEPANRKRILIEPHLGNLKMAQGYVGTPFGNVAVTWNVQPNGAINFTVNVPKGVRATLALPTLSANATLLLDNKTPATKQTASRRLVEIGPGNHAGTLTP